MKTLLCLSQWAALTCATFVLNGCLGSAPMSSLPQTQAPESQAIVSNSIKRDITTSANLYINAFSNGAVVGYSVPDAKNKGPVCQLPANQPGIQSMTTDSDGNLYVGYNPSGSRGTVSYIAEYGPNCGNQIGPTVTDSYGSLPFQLALRGKTRYVADQFGPSFTAGNVAVCSASKCSRELTAKAYGGFVELIGLAVDGKGNVYGEGYAGSGGNAILYEWPGAKMPGHVVKSFNGTGFIATMQFDSHGNIVGLAQDPDEVVIWSGCPKACTVHGPYSLQANSCAAYAALNRKNTLLYVANLGCGSNPKGSIDVYSYQGTAGVTYKYSIIRGIPSGQLAPFSIAIDR